MWLHYFTLAATALTAAPAPETVNTGEIFQFITSALNLGVLGVVFWLFINGRLHSSGELDREVAARQKAEGELAEALKFTRDQVTPLLSDFVHATSALLPILQGLVTRLELTGREDSSRESRRERR